MHTFTAAVQLAATAVGNELGQFSLRTPPHPTAQSLLQSVHAGRSAEDLRHKALVGEYRGTVGWRSGGTSG